MPSSPRHVAAAPPALLALALALAGCQRADPDVVPYSIRLADAGGAPVLASLPADPLVVLEGAATVVGPGELRVQDGAIGLVTITFDAAAHPEVAFPDQLNGQSVRVHAQHNPDARAPGDLPIPYPAMRVALIEASGSRFQFILVDSPYSDDKALPAVPRPIGREVILGDDPAPGFPDFPQFAIVASHSRFEAGACGLIYHDVITAEGVALEAGRTTQSVIGGADTSTWTTLHVDSWHRTGSCPGRAKTWTQWAAWR